MSELCPHCMSELVEVHDYDDDVPCWYCQECREIYYEHEL